MSRVQRHREAMRRTAELFTTGQAAEALFERFASLVIEYIGADCIYLAVPDNGHVRVANIIDHSGRIVFANLAARDTTAITQVLNTGNTVVGTIAGRSGTAVFLPLKLNADVVGVLVVKSERTRAYHDDDLAFLESVALHLAVKLDYDRQLSARAHLEELVATDSLTEVANRRSFDTRLKAEWARAIRSGESLALIMIDLDHFKEFNDSYGHVAGDHALRDAATAMARCIARPGDLLARYGGEEFAVLLPGANLAGAISIAERMRRAVCEMPHPHHEGESDILLSISAGVASVDPRATRDAQALVGAADAALYMAKSEGRDRVIAAETAKT